MSNASDIHTATDSDTPPDAALPLAELAVGSGLLVEDGRPLPAWLLRVVAVVRIVTLDIGHRIGSLALLLLLVSIGVRLAGADVRTVLAITFAAADVALVCSFIAWQLSMGQKSRRREALGAGIFNLLLVLGTITYMLLTHAGI